MHKRIKRVAVNSFKVVICAEMRRFWVDSSTLFFCVFRIRAPVVIRIDLVIFGLFADHFVFFCRPNPWDASQPGLCAKALDLGGRQGLGSGQRRCENAKRSSHSKGSQGTCRSHMHIKTMQVPCFIDLFSEHTHKHTGVF